MEEENDRWTHFGRRGTDRNKMQILLWIWAIGSTANQLTVEEGMWRRASEYLLFSHSDLLCGYHNGCPKPVKAERRL